MSQRIICVFNTPDGGSDLLGALDAKSHVAVVVADGDEGLEAGALTSAGLLLHRHDLQHVVLEGGPQEEVDDLELLKGINKRAVVVMFENEIAWTRFPTS